MAAAEAQQAAVRYQGVDKASFGYKLLANLGWREGEGLGANKQGIAEHIKVKKKFDALGVGAAEHATQLRDWTTGMVSYDFILSGLKEVSRAPQESADNSSSSTSSDSDGRSSGYASESDTSASSKQTNARRQSKGKDTPKQTTNGGKQLKCKLQVDKATPALDSKPLKANKKRKQADAVDEAPPTKSGKKQRKQVSSEVQQTSATDQPATVEPVSAGVARVKLASHVGRYRKREAAKMVSNYSASDLAAILGAGSVAGFPETDQAVAKPVSMSQRKVTNAVAHTTRNSTSSRSTSESGSSSSDSSSSDGSDADNDDSSEQRIRPSTPSPLEESRHADVAVDDAELSTAWWCSTFIKAGRVGSKADAGQQSSRGKIQITGFSEQDQTDLYNQTHGAATQGRQGLGRSGMPKKVGGVRWAGTKTKLVDSDEEGGDNSQQQQQQQQAMANKAVQASEGQQEGTGIVIVMPKKVRVQQADTSSVPAAVQQGGGKSCGQQLPGSCMAGQSGTKGRSKKQTSKQNGQQPTMEAVVKQPAACASVAVSGKKVKWSKLAVKILESAPKRRMRVQKLHQRILEDTGLADAVEDSCSQLQCMLKRLRKAGGFEVLDKHIKLV
eukprot:jgi/Chrzof1/7742/Cz02g35040.t1